MNDQVMEYLKAMLETALIAEIPTDDTSRAGIVTLGPLNDSPEDYRISVEIYENDPDSVFKGNVSGTKSEWADEIDEVEMGGGGTVWLRRYTVKARCLLTTTKEDLTDARRVASVLKARMEKALLRAEWLGVEDDYESVARPVVSESMKSEMLQSGGPPDAYDFMIKIRFDIKTMLYL